MRRHLLLSTVALSAMLTAFSAPAWAQVNVDPPGTVPNPGNLLVISSDLTANVIEAGAFTFAGFDGNGNPIYTGSGSIFQTGTSVVTVNGIHLNYLSPCCGIATYNLQDSAVLSAGGITIGQNGTSIFNQSGSSLANVSGSIFIGNNPAIAGTSSTYNLSGGALSVGGSIEVGTFDQASTGAFNQTGGGTVATDLMLGKANGATGTAAISGGTLTVNNLLGVGYGQGSTGSLTLSGGASAVQNGSQTIIGNGAGSTGTLTVTGAGTSLTTNGLTVGWDGNGTLNVLNGATATQNGNASGVTIGNSAGASGTVNVSGSGSLLEANNELAIGFSGAGTLNVTGGAVVNHKGLNGGSAVIGFNAGAVGAASVDGSGSKLAVTGALQVGQWGSGTLSVGNAGLVTATGLNLGINPGGTGTVTVTGAGSSIDVTGAGPSVGLQLGNGAGTSGTLTISDGGSVSVTATAGAAFLNVGTSSNPAVPGGQGTVTVTGAGSSLSLTGAAGVNTNIGQSLGAIGTMTVSSGATATLGGVSIGTDNATGTFNVLSGGSVNLQQLFAGGGNGGGGAGTALVDGLGSALNFSGGNAQVALGNNGGSGQLTVSNGATVTGVANTNLGNFSGSDGTLTVSGGGTFSTGNATIGQADGSTGALSVSGAGSQFNATGLVSAGGNGTANQGSGSISVLGGASMSASNGMNLGTSTLNVAGGSHLTVGGGGVNLAANFAGAPAAPIVGAASIDGAGSQLLLTAANPFVGLNLGGGAGGNGTLDITNGGALSINASSGFAFLNIASGAPSPGGQGTVLVDGSGSSIGLVGATGSNISIGQNAGATGALTIRNGGSASSAGVGLGINGGTGTILLQSGGTLALGAGGANIAGGAGSSGAITVDGVGSQVSMTGGTTVGNSGTGSLTLSNNAGYTSAGGMTVGNAGGSSGTVLVQSGADLSLTGLTAGGSIGNAAGSTGTVTVTGAGSSWSIANGLTIGNLGTGTLNVNAGAAVVQQGQNGGSTLVGNGNTGQGTLNVNGGTMTLLNAELGAPSERHAFLGVGRDGTGTVNVSNGGQLTIGTAGSGSQPGSTFGAGINIGGNQTGSATTTPPFIGAVQGIGTVNVDGASSRIDLLGAGAFINVGRFGSASQGTLQITNGGQVSGMQAVTVGRGATDSSGTAVAGFGATGTLLLSGANSQLNINGVGTSGAGASLSIGSQDGSGTATVSSGAILNVGAAAATTTAGGIFIGNGIAGSNGTLNIQSGATVNVASSLAGPAVAVGQSLNGTLSMNGGTLSVIGTDALLFVGRNGGSTGTATVLGGATVNADAIVVGTLTGSIGSMLVSGNGTTLNLVADAQGTPTTGGGLSVGRAGTGTMTIAGGATVNINGADGGAGIFVGGSNTASGGTGTLVVTGAGTSISNVGAGATSLFIGRADGANPTASTGTMTISGGATVNLGAAATASVGYSAGSTGTLTVTGAGSLLDAGSFLGIGRSVADPNGGTGLLNVTNGGQVIATTVHNGATGTITGSGTISATTFINDGTINPGNSPGTLRIHVADFQNNGTIVLEILKNADGSYSLDELVFDDGFVPDLHDVEFRFLGATDPGEAAAAGQLDLDNFLKAEDQQTGQVISLFAALQNQGDPNLLEQFNQAIADTTFSALSAGGDPLGTGTFDLRPDGAATNDVHDVPEPMSFALLASGLLGLGWLRRRRAA